MSSVEECCCCLKQCAFQTAICGGKCKTTCCMRCLVKIMRSTYCCPTCRGHLKKEASYEAYVLSRDMLEYVDGETEKFNEATRAEFRNIQTRIRALKRYNASYSDPLEHARANGHLRAMEEVAKKGAVAQSYVAPFIELPFENDIRSVMEGTEHEEDADTVYDPPRRTRRRIAFQEEANDMMPPQEIIVIDGRNYPRNRTLPASLTPQMEANATPRLDFRAARMETRNGTDYFHFEPIN